VWRERGRKKIREDLQKWQKGGQGNRYQSAALGHCVPSFLLLFPLPFLPSSADHFACSLARIFDDVMSAAGYERTGLKEEDTHLRTYENFAANEKQEENKARIGQTKKRDNMWRRSQEMEAQARKKISAIIRTRFFFLSGQRHSNGVVVNG
jgi:hypothetical protein